MDGMHFEKVKNGTVHFFTLTLIIEGTTENVLQWNSTLKKVNNCMNTNIYSYLETSGGQSSNPYLNIVHFLITRAD